MLAHNGGNRIEISTSEKPHVQQILDDVAKSASVCIYTRKGNGNSAIQTSDYATRVTPIPSSKTSRLHGLLDKQRLMDWQTISHTQKRLSSAASETKACLPPGALRLPSPQFLMHSGESSNLK